MTLTRRQVLAAGAVAGVGGLAGCLGWPDDQLAASPATVGTGALAETGYDEHVVEEWPIERTVDRFGIDRTISVTNWYAEYDRSVSLPGLSRLQAAVVSVLSTPQISILGRTVNPVGEYSTGELVALIQERYDEVRDIRFVDEESVTTLDTETTIDRYRASARLIEAGTTIDVYLAITEPVSHGDDFVIPIAIYPQFLGLEVESASVRTLLEAIDHE